MHGLDPATTVLTAALALMTAFALASETPFAGGRGARAASPVRAVDRPAATLGVPADGWIALNAPGVGTLPPLVARGR